jgi:hypothetical protein
MFSLREQNRAERKTRKSINEFEPTFDQNSFIDFCVFLSALFCSLKLNMPSKHSQ